MDETKKQASIGDETAMLGNLLGEINSGLDNLPTKAEDRWQRAIVIRRVSPQLQVFRAL